MTQNNPHEPDKQRQKIEPARNSAERDARGQYISEAAQTGRDPLPNSKPDWAKNLPDPSKHRK
jgi:hypothetical protein